jgi:hypothetical protein
MTTKRAAILFAAIAGLIGLAVASTAVTAAPRMYVSPLMDLPLLSDDDCGACIQEGCDPEEHKLMSMPNGDGEHDRRFGEMDHGCEEGWCGDAHDGVCEGGSFATLNAERKTQLWRAVLSESESNLPLLLANLGEAVSFNATRGAIQVQGCNGDIVLSIPVTAAQAEQFVSP